MALVASIKEKDVVNQTVLILQGGQGVGKSTFLLGLAPKELSDYVFSGNLNPNNKDSIIQLSETIICQLDELETLTKYKEGALKELITPPPLCQICRQAHAVCQPLRIHKPGDNAA